jgi:dihydrofolate reductase
MAKLTYLMITSLDGYVADEHSKFDWGKPDEEVHFFVNELERPAGTFLLGRRMYEVLLFWEALELEGQSPAIQEFAGLWKTADKIVYSRTLDEVASTRTRIEREFDPEAVRRLKAESDRDLSIGGPELAAHAFRAGLVDEYQVFLAPIVVGGGTQALPDDVRVELDLLDERRFDNGMVHLRYGIGHASSERARRGSRAS